MTHRTTPELESYVAELRAASAESGTLAMVVRRPTDGEREVLDVGELDLEGGLIGDNWEDRATRAAKLDGLHRKAQLNVMSARMVSFLAPSVQEQAMAGDQLYVDLDISVANLPAGSRLAIGTAVIEVTDKPHNGCKKFVARFGEDAAQFVNSPVGKALRLRGLNARVVTPGVVRPGDAVRKL